MQTQQLDHLVINAKYGLDDYVQLFTGLGFTLTPRNRHSLGSANQLILFADDYLELIGLEVGRPVRQEILDSRDGIDGLVIKMDDPESTSQYLAKAELAAQPLQHFERQLTTGELAKFATIRLVPGQFNEGRVYYCQHLTPELVWQQQYMTHANKVSGFKSLMVVVDDVTAANERYARLGDLSLPLQIIDRQTANQQFGVTNTDVNYFAAITFSTPEPQLVADFAKSNGITFRHIDNQVIVPTADGSLLLFTN